MKLSKKKVFVLALAICLIAVLSMGSLAWFTDSDEVTNNFLVAGSENENPDEIFSVDIWEKDENGNRYDDGIEYPAILPGDELYKEVNVENTGSYPQYVRVTVKVSDAAKMMALMGGDLDLSELTDFDVNAQPIYELLSYYDSIADEYVFMIYYENELAVDEVRNVFNKVNIPEEMTREDAAEMGADGFYINVVADAVQTENVGDNVVEAFKTVGLYVYYVNPSNILDALAAGATNLVLDPTANWDAAITVATNIADVNINANGTNAAFKFTGLAENVVISGIIDTAESTAPTLDVTAALEGSSVTLKDCYLISNGQNAKSSIRVASTCDLTIDGCTLTNDGNKSNAIYGYTSANMTITNSDFVGFAKSWAVMINGTTYGDILIDNCEFVDCLEGIFKNSVTGAGHNGLSNGDFTFTNNTLTNCGGHDGSEAKMFDTDVTGTITVDANTRDGAAYAPDASNGITQV